MINAAKPHLIITSPGSFLQFCAHMDKMKTFLDKQANAINEATQACQRSLQFVVDQFAASPLAKKRAAKINLTAACNRALSTARRTWREHVAELTKPNSAPTVLQLRELLHNRLQANAPNDHLNQFEQLRQQQNQGRYSPKI